MKNPWLVIDDEVDGYNERQYQEMYRSTNFVIDCLDDIETFSSKKSFTVLDVGCSAGAHLYHLASRFSGHNYIGIDINQHYLNQAISIHNKLDIQNTRFECVDYKSIDECYDVIGSNQTMLSLELKDGHEFQSFCFDKSNSGVFFLSLFSERLLDFEIYVHDYNYSETKKVPYCIHSLPKLIQLANDKGFGLVKDSKFNIDIDLPDCHDGRGTYTIRNEDLDRMMFSDVLYMPWRFVYFERINL